MKLNVLKGILRPSRYRLAIALGFLLIGIAFSGLLVSSMIGKRLTEEAQQKVLWEARLYAEQLERTVVRIASRLDFLVFSSPAEATDTKSLVRRLDTFRNESAGVVRVWLVYPDGHIVTSSNTSSREIVHRPVWQAFLQGKRPTSFSGVLLSETKSIMSLPFKETEEGPALVTLVSIFIQGNTIARVGGLDLNIAQAVTDETRSGINWIWSRSPVAVYTPTGHLIASPLEEERRLIPGLRDDSEQTLVRYFLTHPNQAWGTLLYKEGGESWIGAFVRDRTLGMVITVKRPGKHLLVSARKVATILTATALLSMVLAALFVTVGYSTELQFRELQYRNKKAELQALQAYVNPHFLLNALSCLCSLANPRDYQLIPKAVKAIAEVLRYTLKGVEAFVPLYEEMACIRNYITVQKLRFRDRFEYEEAIPEEFLSLSIPKLTIQPLVENCFVHGVERTLDQVTIRVTAVRNGASLEVHVTNDGPGFEPEKLAMVQNLLRYTRETSPPSLEHGIGLLNTHRRLLLIYGNSAGLTIREENGKTIVTVSLPLGNHKP